MSNTNETTNTHSSTIPSPMDAGHKHHGLSRTPTHNSWAAMKQRCTDPHHKSYNTHGGGAGIHVCESWMNFRNFLRDMGIRPDGAQLERMDRNKGYEPGNCHWATVRQKARNSRRIHFVTAFGETKTIEEWYEDPRCKVGTHVLAGRIRNHMAPEAAITSPLLYKKRKPSPTQLPLAA